MPLIALGRKKKFERQLAEQRYLYLDKSREEEVQWYEKEPFQEQLRQSNQQLEQERQVRAEKEEEERREQERQDEERERKEEERKRKEKERRAREQARREKNESDDTRGSAWTQGPHQNQIRARCGDLES